MAEKYRCACCGQFTLEAENESDICPVCGWEEDSLQNSEPDYEGGANEMSLNQARRAWANGEAIY